MSRGMSPRRWLSAFAGGLGALLIATATVVLVALAVGYRPVVITTGSMGDTAPAGSLVIAAPRAADDVQVGDVVVMRRAGAAPVTHRVIEIESGAAGRFAITQGDANATADAVPYPIQGDQLVMRWSAPKFGTWVEFVRDPRFALGMLAALLVAVTVIAIRRIWAVTDEPGKSDVPDVPGEPALPLADGEPPAGDRANVSGRRHVGALVAVVAALAGGGILLALYTSAASVDANVFQTSDCFDTQLAAVQSGETVHAVSGTVSVPITAVDRAAAFVLASVRGASNEPADATVATRLADDGTAVELIRLTDAGAPPAVTVAWSVVEYACGVTVQHGTVAGDGDNAVTVPTGTVDPAASFALVTTASEADATSFDGDDLVVAELTSPSQLTIGAAPGVVLTAQRRFEWQVVTFADPADVAVQTVTANLANGQATTTATLGPPVDTTTTFLLTGVTTASAGADIGERLVRTHLADPTSIQISRDVAGDALEVRIQVVTLRDGSKVRHGTVDLAAGSASATVTLDPVDPSRSVAISTVAIPGVSAGGQTDHTADDVPGEAAATFTVTNPTTVTIARAATASAASFGWQVIEWAGPRWWDPGYLYRQRIDVDTTTAATPDEYTVPLTLDHAALVASGLSQADGDDVRILRWNGTAWTELDRVLDDDSAWDQVDTTLWFRTTDPIAAGSTQTYWLYLANPAAGPAPSDPEAVYLLVENFDAGDFGDFEDRTGGTGWYSADAWTRRIPVTVPAGRVASALTDFPLLVSLTSADLAANAQADGSDLRFTAADGTTALAHEIESYDSGTGALAAWVQVPALPSASATTIYLYYGAANAPDQQDVHATWPADVEAVWHLADDPAGSAPQLDDSSPHNHDGLSVGSMTAADLVTGLVGSAIDLDGTDDGLQAGPIGLAAVQQLTISGWIRLDAYTNDPRLFSKASDNLQREVDVAVQNTGAVRARLLLDTGEVTATTVASTVTLGTWHHIAAVWDGTNLEIVVDGTVRATTPAIGDIDPRPTLPVNLGNLATQDRPLDGLLDEVRVETTARSLAWLDAANDNQRSPAAFLTIGAVESGTWFAQGTWAYRKPVVVDADQVPADVAGFPLLVQVADAELQASAQACACDFVFTGADGTTRLDHLVEAYDPGTGALTAWVRVPVLSGSEDTELFLYYGNPTAVDQQDPPAVFGSDADLQMLGAS